MSELKDKIEIEVMNKISILLRMFEKNHNTVISGIYILTGDYGLKAAPFMFEQNREVFGKPEAITEIAREMGAKAVMFLARSVVVGEGEYLDPDEDHVPTHVSICGRLVTGDLFLIYSKFNELEQKYERPMLQYTENVEMFQADQIVSSLLQPWYS